ncbi:MAG: class I SAM-dependent methyltransferase [Alphaproteobacteria bacterium]|nr:class I SAM-dependent methyltransferase [Alphaproteobacteria bacterium]
MSMHDQHYSGKETLEFLKEAVNYNRFLEEELLRFLAAADEALDFGAGNGEFALRLAAHGKRITTVEADPFLRETLATHGFTTMGHIEAAPTQQRIYSLNVLEHIEDDAATLHQFHEKLQAGGRLFLYVPAFHCLYSDFDRAVGHHRRYTKKTLLDKLEKAGFAIRRAEYVDALGFICWFSMRNLPGDKTKLNPAMVKLFDRLVFPASRIIDRATKHLFGKNLLVIAQKK